MIKISAPNKNNSPTSFLTEIGTFIFQVFLISYLLFFIIDRLKPGYISNFFNPNIILAVCLVGSFLIIINQRKKTKWKRLF